jgi:hypothetical protein
MNLQLVQIHAPLFPPVVPLTDHGEFKDHMQVQNTESICE